MVVVTVSEMYDMATRKGVIGVLGIHTPTGDSIARRWHGLCTNFKYMRLLSCDIRIACASLLPADPLQIGTDTSDDSKISPQDLMNPILYRACTNESWNAVLNRIYATAGVTDVNGVKYIDNAFTSLNYDQNETLYYGLLAEQNWAKAMPQQGLTMTGLKPFVFPVLNAFGNTLGYEPNKSAGNMLDFPTSAAAGANGEPATPSGSNRMATFRGPAQPMPAMPCTVPGSTPIEGYPYQFLTPNTPWKTYVACVVMPPAKTQIMYFRMIIRWKIEFTGVVSAMEKENASGILDAGQYSYNRTYQFTSGSKLSEVAGPDDEVVDVGSVDSVNTNPKLVMEK